MLCSFGCGKEAIKYFKSSGNWCCSHGSSSCPAQKNKNSSSSTKALWQQFDWEAIQKEYDSGLSTRKISEEFKISSGVLATATKHGKFKARSKVEADASRLGKCFIPQSSLDNMSRLAKERKLGGYNPKGGRGKKGRYKGVWCDSSWELAWVIYAVDHNLEFKKNTEKFPYEFNGETLYYIPDFILANGEYVEIKGYQTDQVSAKIEHFPHVLTVLREQEIKQYLSYAVSKFGKNFTEVYEQ